MNWKKLVMLEMLTIFAACACLFQSLVSVWNWITVWLQVFNSIRITWNAMCQYDNLLNVNSISSMKKMHFQLRDIFFKEFNFSS